MPDTLLDDIAAAPAEPDYVPPEPAPKPAVRTKRGRGRPRKNPLPDDVIPDMEGDKDEDKPAPRKPRSPSVSARKLSDDLLGVTVELASDLSPFAPTVAGVLISRAEVAVDGMMALAKGKPRVEAALRKVTSVSKVAELFSFGVLLVAAAAVDSGRIPPSSPLLDHLGYAELIRDDNGKPLRDEAGRIRKTRRTLRDIRTTMVGEDPTVGMPVSDMPSWEPVGPESTNTREAFFPPMNWTSQA